MGNGPCIYCGENRDLTNDHVPPRSFYGMTPPANLITVPSCERCNRGFSVDDDYVRLVLATDERAKGNQERDEIIAKVMRYSQRSQSRRSLSDFYASLGAGYHQNPQGVTVWTHHHLVDGRRMNAFAVRTTKALFFREKQYRLPDDIRVNPIHWTFFRTMLECDAGDFFGMILSELAEPRLRQVWGQVFAYAWIQSPNDVHQTWWLLEFYGSIEWVCSTVNPALLR
jgi:hypothetical protein